MRVAILIYDGFDELDAVAPFEVFRSAAVSHPDLVVQLVTLDGSDSIVASHGLHVRPDARLDEHDPPDLLLVPGGGWNMRAERGAWGEAQRGAIPAVIARLHAAGVTIATVCTGGMLAATAGILRGRPAVTHHSALDDLRASGAEVIAARVVDDGTIISAGGITSGLDLALWVVERYFGAESALTIEREMEYERRGTVWRRERAG